MTLVIVAVAVATVAAAETVCSVRRRRAQSARARCVERITELMVTRGELGDDDILQLRSDFSDRVILDAVVFIASRVCGTSLYRLSFVVEVCESDYHFLSTLARVFAVVAFSQSSSLHSSNSRFAVSSWQNTLTTF